MVCNNPFYLRKSVYEPFFGEIWGDSCLKATRNMQTTFEKWLARIGWIETFAVEFDLPPGEVAQRLQQRADVGHDFGLFEVFATRQKPYTGYIDANSFTLRRRRKLFDWNTGLARIKGTMQSQNQGTIVTTNIAFPTFLPISLVVIFVVFYGICIALIAMGVFGEDATFILPFVLLQGVILALIFYFILHWEIKWNKKYFEQDLRRII